LSLGHFWPHVQRTKLFSMCRRTVKTWHFVQAYSHEAPLRILFNFVLNRIGMKFGRNVVHLNTHWLSESDFRLDIIISKRLPWRYLRRSVLCCHLGSENEASAASRCSRARYSSWSKHLYLFLLILYFALLRLRMQEVSIKDVEDYKEAVLSVFDKNTDGRLSGENWACCSLSKCNLSHHVTVIRPRPSMNSDRFYWTF